MEVDGVPLALFHIFTVAQMTDDGLLELRRQIAPLSHLQRFGEKADARAGEGRRVPRDSVVVEEQAEGC